MRYDPQGGRTLRGDGSFPAEDDTRLRYPSDEATIDEELEEPDLDEDDLDEDVDLDDEES